MTPRSALFVLAALAAAGPASAAGPEGLWLTQDRDGVIEVRPCDNGLCGRIAGMREPVQPGRQHPD